MAKQVNTHSASVILQQSSNISKAPSYCEDSGLWHTADRDVRQQSGTRTL